MHRPTLSISLILCARLYTAYIYTYIYDRHHTVYFSKCFYALLFHRHLSTFHTMRMRGVYVFDSTCTVLAVYKVVQMDPEDRRRARLSRRRQRERDRRASESAEQRESRLARRRARDRARCASQSETLEDREARLQQLSRLSHNHLLLSHFVVYTYTWCMYYVYINQQNSWSTLSPLIVESLPLAHNAQHCPSYYYTDSACR